MSQSLSIILPVYNAEEKLANHVVELLEITAELTQDVELLIVDDGSTDNTEEVAMELCRAYPQVTVLRWSRRVGVMAAARAGIEKTTGDVVLIHDIESPLSGEAVRQFWQMRDDHELVFARAELAHPGPTAAAIGQKRGVTAWSGTQMLRRQAVNELQQAPQGKSTIKIDRVMRTDVVSANPAVPTSVLQQFTEGR